jgi:Helix-turn-helix domain/DnaT DNA-binding domain
MVVQITAVLPTTAADSSPRLNSQLPLQATTAFAIAPCASPRRCCFKFHSTRKDRCFPSHEAVAEWIGLTRRRVIEAIKELEQYGYVAVVRGHGRSNAYRFNFGVTLATRIEAESGDANDISEVTPATQVSDASNTSEVTLPTPYPVALPSEIDPVTLPSGRRSQIKSDALGKDALGEQSKLINLPRHHSQRKSRGELPQNWRPSDTGIDFAFKHGMTGEVLEDEVAHFTAHHRRKATLSADWDAEWQVWVLNDKQFRRKANSQRRGRSTYRDILFEEDAV